MKLDQQIEGVLFYKAVPLTKKSLMKLFETTPEELEAALHLLQKRLESGATRLTLSESEVALVTAPELDEMIEVMRKDDMKRDIGKAGAETLAIILYKGPISRSEIDRIRGVNSSYILRNLLVRGLIEKNTTTKNVAFQATTDLMAHLGITQRTELNDFESVMTALENYEKTQDAVTQ